MERAMMTFPHPLNASRKLKLKFVVGFKKKIVRLKAMRNQACENHNVYIFYFFFEYLKKYINI